MKNALFSLNPKQNTFLETVCKNVRFFAYVPEMDSPDGQYGHVKEPDWGVGMQVSGRVCFRPCRTEKFAPATASPSECEYFPTLHIKSDYNTSISTGVKSPLPEFRASYDFNYTHNNNFIKPVYRITARGPRENSR